MSAADVLRELDAIRYEVLAAIRALLPVQDLPQVQRLEIRLTALDHAMDAVLRWEAAK